MSDIFYELIDKLDEPWVIFGFAAQAAFFMRFAVQWVASERAGRSIIPVAFWYFSIVGAAGLLTYAVVYTRDPVVIAGQSLGFVIYFRNLMLIYRRKKHDLMAETPVGDNQEDHADHDRKQS
ncbi:MAG: lipid-A-disaccharide synthase N-terminal domain-containing protein [Alphaproteobacteria bacterium]|jgi:lipid-A-disaccharide synthase-like uncharacterized protein